MGRNVSRQRRKPRPAETRALQRTPRIRHGFASFGRYYFTPEKKINTKKVWILSGDKSFSVWRGSGEEVVGVMRNRCGPGRRGARVRGWGGVRPPPTSRPGSAGAAPASPASVSTPPSEPRDARSIARDAALLPSARLPLKLCRRRMRLFSPFVIPHEFSRWGGSALSQPPSS